MVFESVSQYRKIILINTQHVQSLGRDFNFEWILS